MIRFCDPSARILHKSCLCYDYCSQDHSNELEQLKTTQGLYLFDLSFLCFLLSKNVSTNG